MPRVIQVIESTVTRGCGRPRCGDTRPDHVHEICRAVTQYHTLDGDLLAESDPVDPDRRVLVDTYPLDLDVPHREIPT